MCSRGPRIPLLGSSVTVLVGSTSFPTIYRVFSMRAGFESDVSSLFFFSCISLQNWAYSRHPWLPVEWMDGWMDQSKESWMWVEYCINLCFAKKHNKIDWSTYHFSSIYLSMSSLVSTLSIYHLSTCYICTYLSSSLYLLHMYLPI